jgi:hypothetical protein
MHLRAARANAPGERSREAAPISTSPRAGEAVFARIARSTHCLQPAAYSLTSRSRWPREVDYPTTNKYLCPLRTCLAFGFSLMSRFDRRKFLASGLQLSSVVFVAKARASACVDTDELSDSVLGMRESLEYTDEGKNPQQVCNTCTYFKPAKPGDSCGPCEVLTSPVSAKGYCVSWTKKG